MNGAEAAGALMLDDLIDLTGDSNASPSLSPLDSIVEWQIPWPDAVVFSINLTLSKVLSFQHTPASNVRDLPHLAI